MGMGDNREPRSASVGRLEDLLKRPCVNAIRIPRIDSQHLDHRIAGFLGQNETCLGPTPSRVHAFENSIAGASVDHRVIGGRNRERQDKAFVQPVINRGPVRAAIDTFENSAPVRRGVECRGVLGIEDNCFYPPARRPSSNEASVDSLTTHSR